MGIFGTIWGTIFSITFGIMFGTNCGIIFGIILYKLLYRALCFPSSAIAGPGGMGDSDGDGGTLVVAAVVAEYRIYNMLYVIYYIL